ncbi:hypothetical protein GCM10010466_40410 [Planomonospora alba]|uniref:Uncharacterized protein n=1 Tax=Planomonospora alba TaxID=161354 RepID=A0ABP6NE78_9ACTN
MLDRATAESGTSVAGTRRLPARDEGSGFGQRGVGPVQDGSQDAAGDGQVLGGQVAQSLWVIGPRALRTSVHRVRPASLTSTTPPSPSSHSSPAAVSSRRQLRRLDKVLDDLHDELLAPLTPAERDQLVRLLIRLVDHHTPGGASPPS